ncbi:isoprenoid biosynthesis glyoxalase ElbB [Nitrospinae bacterium]|jgi:enhancing lycopene biosynthesis protein 2|nr:isoprenoid biosynthesis glyoxalase ElbB [Nitrospinota bacterium]
MKKIGVVLSGCGVFDGAEIHESVITLLAIDRAGAQAVCMAPNVDQMHVVNHLTGEVSDGEKRNVLVEAARIARGEIKDIATVKADELDAIVFPGGFGAAKNLSSFAVKGENCDVHPEVLRLVKEFAAKNKPQAALCIAPAMMAKIYEDAPIKPTLTIGNDKDCSSKIETMGSTHQECSARDFVFDEQNNVISTPAYMRGQSISEVAEGIEKTIHQLLKMTA